MGGRTEDSAHRRVSSEKWMALATFLSGKGLFSYKENQENAYSRITLNQIKRPVLVGQRTVQQRHFMWFNQTLTFTSREDRLVEHGTRDA